MESTETIDSGSMNSRIIPVTRYYGSLKGMERKYDKYSRAGAFLGESQEEWKQWKSETRRKLWNLLGLNQMETCDLNPQILEQVMLDNGILREKVLLQVEPDTWMPVFILIPPKREGEEKQSCFIAPPGHQGAGKYSVAGCSDIPAVKDAIDKFNYDYGMQLAKLGYVALCPDARGFGERRDEAFQNNDETCFMRSTCFYLAHMAEPLGQTVAGMCTWDLMRLIDYIEERGQWRTDNLGCLGFSGGGMQTLWLAAMDERIRQAFISGYMYGYKDALLKLNGNCSCNYVPGLWKLVDMGDIGSLIAPRPLVVQSCTEDRLNGERGIVNAKEQVEIIRAAYGLFGKEELVRHEICGGGHQFHSEHLSEDLDWMRKELDHIREVQMGKELEQP